MIPLLFSFALALPILQIFSAPMGLQRIFGFREAGYNKKGGRKNFLLPFSKKLSRIDNSATLCYIIAVLSITNYL